MDTAMKTLDGLAYGIIELYRASYKDTDSLNIRLVKKWIQEYRAFLLKQKFMRPLGELDHSYVQTLTVQDLEVVDSGTVAGGDALESFLLATTDTVPKPIENNKGNYSITRIALPDMKQSNLSLYSYERALYAGNGRFNTKELYPFFYNNKIYIKSKLTEDELSEITLLQISGVFQDPYEAGYLDTQQYPIAESMVREIHELIKKEKFPYVSTPLEDTLADDADNIINPTRNDKAS